MRFLWQHSGRCKTIDRNVEGNRAKIVVFYGRIIRINDRITYEGDNVKSLCQDFKEAVDEYLETCSQLGKNQKKYTKVRSTSE